VENREIGQRILENFSKIGILHSCTTHKGFADPETSTFNFFILSMYSEIARLFVRFWSAFTIVLRAPPRIPAARIVSYKSVLDWGKHTLAIR
jgi:hypothetical protein